jgi:hypothetical protein
MPKGKYRKTLRAAEFRQYCDRKLKTITLSGNSKDRRKQLRSIYQSFPDAKITLRGPVVYKNINDKSVECEEANSARTIVFIEYPIEFKGV